MAWLLLTKAMRRRQTRKALRRVMSGKLWTHFYQLSIAYFLYVFISLISRLLQVDENNKVKTKRIIKRRKEQRGGSTSLQGRQTSGRVSSSDPIRLLFIKLNSWTVHFLMKEYPRSPSFLWWEITFHDRTDTKCWHHRRVQTDVSSCPFTHEKSKSL